MAKKIKYSDLVEGDAFGKLIQEGTEFDRVLQKMADSYTKLITAKKGSLGSTPTTLKDAEDMQKLVESVTQLDAGLTKVKKTREQLTVETAKAKIQQQEYDKAIKETAKDELGLVSAYQKESKTLNDMRKQYKDLALSQKESTKEGKELLANITKLDSKLKAVDATVGQHQRNVGNYAQSLGGLKTGLLEIGGALGIAFGVHQVVDFGKESVKAFLDAEKNAISLKNAVHGNTLAFDTLMKQSAELQDKSIFSDDDIQMAQKQLAVYGLTTSQIEKLIPQIVDLASKTGDDLATATDKSISAINGQTKGLKEVGISFKDTGSKTENFTILTEKLTKFQGASAEALETTIGKTKRLENAFGDIQETIGEFLVNSGNQFLDFLEIAKGGIDDVLIRDATEKSLEVVDIYNRELIKGAKETEKNRLIAIKYTEEQIKKISELGIKEKDFVQKSILKNQLKNQQNLLEELKKLKDKEVIEDDATMGAKVEKAEDFEKKLRDLQTENIRITYDRKKQEIQNNFDDETKKYAGHTKILEELAKKRAIALENLWYDHEKEMQKIRDNAMKVEELKEMKADDPVFSPKVKAKQDKIKKDAEDEEKRREQERKNALTQSEMLLDIWREGQEKKSEEALAYIDHELDRNKSAIEIQAELASRGMENTLAFEMKKQDELEKARVQELERQKKVAKQQEALELSLAFLKAYETYISQDMKSGQALLRARGDIMTAKLLSKAIAGSAFDGVEDTGGAGNVDSKGGKLWVLHPNERVLTKEQNQKLNGIGNDELVDKALMFDNIMKPNFNSSMAIEDATKVSQVNTALTSSLLREVRELKQVMINKPTSETKLDNLGNVIKRTTENGLTKTTIKKTYLS